MLNPTINSHATPLDWTCYNLRISFLRNSVYVWQKWIISLLPDVYVIHKLYQLSQIYSYQICEWQYKNILFTLLNLQLDWGAFIIVTLTTS